jgi:hypothetical protein
MVEKKRVPRRVKPVSLPCRAAVVATLDRLGVDPMLDARAQVALTLADSLDAGAGMATAAVARELRATLTELEEHHGGGSSELDRFLASMSSEVGDPKV